MSYALHIWDHYPLPANDEEADELYVRLSQETGPQNPKFIELAKRLTARYPCITTLDDDDPGAVWTDGPLDGKTNRQVYGLGVDTDYLNVMVPFVAATAGALGLTVYDMQAGEVYLPSGQVLTLPGRAPVNWTPTEEEELQSKRQVADILVEGLRPLLEPHGFKNLKGRAYFRRRLKGFDQEIEFFSERDYPGYEINACFDVRPRFDNLFGEELATVAKNHTTGFCCLSKDKMAGIASIAPPPGKPLVSRETGEILDRRVTVKTHSELMDYIARLAEFISMAVLPILEHCVTPQQLDSYLNSTNQDRNPFFSNANIGIFIAYAVESPRLQTLIDEELQKASEENREILKNEILPLLIPKN
jgi:hypothetical protein